MNNRVLCRNCDWLGTESDLLRAPNPFVEGEDITACPHCKNLEDLRVACARDGCRQEGSCGTKDRDGQYVWLCGYHFRVLDAGRLGSPP